MEIEETVKKKLEEKGYEIISISIFPVPLGDYLWGRAITDCEEIRFKISADKDIKIVELSPIPNY